MFFLDENKIPKITEYLHQKNWLKAEEKVIGTAKPGEGNMNCVLRIDTGNKTFILKQSRNFVVKYPQVPAPVERVQSEAAFYCLTKHEQFLAQHTPAILGFDQENNMLMLQDLGTASDYSFLYENNIKLKEEDAVSLTHFLYILHNNIEKNNDPLFCNTAMKQLNHKYIFVYPFMNENGFDLNGITKGLEDAAAIYKNDIQLKSKVLLLGELYLEEGKHLLHGDYYPGSWLNTKDGIKIIDPEFCFFGPVEFDLAVMVAHCYLSQQPQNIIDLIINSYQEKSDFNFNLMHQFAGVEIMRRILGLAQLPLSCGLAIKKQLLQKGYEFIMQ